MGKNKIGKFAVLDTLPNVFQYPYGRLAAEGFGSFPLRGNWGRKYFFNSNPLVIELGCGKGEYTVGLAQQYPDKNFIGIDIKGARMYTGAVEAHKRNMPNVAFLRTSIELLDNFFASGEVSEIWITFPDPQMKKVNKRLTGTRFMSLYRKVLASDGVVNLKTDSPFLYAYTRAMATISGLDLLADTADLYHCEAFKDNEMLHIRTHYERQWLARGLTIKYLAFILNDTTELVEPPDDFEHDTYRSYSRGYIDNLN